MIFTMSTTSPLVMVREGMDGSVGGVGSAFTDQVSNDIYFWLILAKI